MPVGIIVNAFSVVMGGVIGTFAGRGLSDQFKENINMIFGVCSMGMGIGSIMLMKNMPAVVFALIFGTIIGLAMHLGNRIENGACQMQKLIACVMSKSGQKNANQEFTTTLITAIVLFCASGTGIYGAIMSGMSGDHSILIAKSILDFFTALIFACSLGVVVSLVAIPQALIFLLLFVLAGRIYSLTTPAMIDDFKACGGFLMLATGFRIIKVKMFPIADMLPGMVLVMPFSLIWVNFVLPML